MISFSCSACRAKLQRQDGEAGTTVLCPSCNQKLLVPTPPRLADKTMLGELQATDNRTLLGELQPAPVARVQTRPAAQPASAAISSASLIRCSCPHCNAVINADPRSAGTRSSCPSCGCPVEIPLPKASLIEDGQAVPRGLVTAQTAGTADPFALADEPSAPGYSRGSKYRQQPQQSWLGFAAVVFAVLCLLTCIGYGSASSSYRKTSKQFNTLKLSPDDEIGRFYLQDLKFISDLRGYLMTAGAVFGLFAIVSASAVFMQVNKSKILSLVAYGLCLVGLLIVVVSG